MLLGIPGTVKNQLLVEEGRKIASTHREDIKILLSQDIAVEKRNKLLLQVNGRRVWEQFGSQREGTGG